MTRNLCVNLSGLCGGRSLQNIQHSVTLWCDDSLQNFFFFFFFFFFLKKFFFLIHHRGTENTEVTQRE